ncbi:MAG: hypothetical protein KDD42_07610 [Bdellovibrionales bacterium]|nr:hypothetical protein [Bdellovibrionales bacterium]
MVLGLVPGLVQPNFLTRYLRLNNTHPLMDFRAFGILGPGRTSTIDNRSAPTRPAPSKQRHLMNAQLTTPSDQLDSGQALIEYKREAFRPSGELNEVHGWR